MTDERTRRRIVLEPTATSDGLAVVVTRELAMKCGRGVDEKGHAYLADPRWLLLDEDGTNGRRARIDALLMAGHLNLEGVELIPRLATVEAPA